jgi:hypothetical protein
MDSWPGFMPVSDYDAGRPNRGPRGEVRDHAVVVDLGVARGC